MDFGAGERFGVFDLSGAVEVLSLKGMIDGDEMRMRMRMEEV